MLGAENNFLCSNWLVWWRAKLLSPRVDHKLGKIHKYPTLFGGNFYADT